MAWVRLDDGYDDHRKVISVGYEAAWMNVRAILWCNRNESDGHLPFAALDRVGADFPPKKRSQLVTKLLEKGMWHGSGHGCEFCPQPTDEYVIHDYLEYQPPKSRKDDERAAARERMRRARESNPKNTPRSEDVRGEHVAKFAESSDNPVPGPVPKPVPKERKASTKISSPAKPTDFDRFWAAYPRHEAKAAARKAWDKRIRDGTDPELLIAAASNYATWSSKFRQPDYVKHPATWLNAGCELDELDHEPRGPTGGKDIDAPFRRIIEKRYGSEADNGIPRSVSYRPTARPELGEGDGGRGSGELLHSDGEHR